MSKKNITDSPYYPGRNLYQNLYDAHVGNHEQRKFIEAHKRFCEEYLRTPPAELPEKIIRTEPILGKRKWNIDNKGFLTGMTTCSQHKKWEKVEEAACRRSKWDRYHYNIDKNDPEYVNHKPPVFSCTCGIYAFFANKWEMIADEDDAEKSLALKDLNTVIFLIERGGNKYLQSRTEELLNQFVWQADRRIAFGFISAWGRIVEHCEGFRCQYAQVQRIILPLYTPKDIREELSHNYDCDVSVLDEETIKGVQKQYEREERQREAARMFEDRGWLKRPELFVPEVKVSLDWKGRTRVEVSPSKYQHFSDLLDRNLIIPDEIKRNYKRAKPKE